MRAVTCRLEDSSDLAAVGNKAYNLREMLSLGVNVPPGFVVTNSVFCQLRHQLSDSNIPDRILKRILHARRQLPPGPVIVRSSAVGEDSATASFAGQLVSIPNVVTAPDIERALKQCWASYGSRSVQFYERARKVQLSGMGAIVQVQVSSRISGVLFTSPPAGVASPDELYGEYCPGFGEDLVLGRVNPGRFRISKADNRYTVDRRPDEMPVSDEAVLFNSEQIYRLSQTAMRLEKHFGSPQDIEWTIDERGDLFFVQTRSITVHNRARSQTLWSNANINENYPAPVSPFLHSVACQGYYHYFRNLAIAFGFSADRVRLMEQSLRNIVGVHYGRLYYNLSNIHSVLRIAPCGETLAKFFNNFVGASKLAERRETRKRSVLARAWEGAQVLCKTTGQYLFITRRINRFERIVDEFANATHPSRLAGQGALELRDHLREFMAIRCDKWTDAALADTASMVCYGVLKTLLTRKASSLDQRSLHNDLLKGLGGVESVKPTIELWKLARKIESDPALARLFATSPTPEILTALQADRRLAGLNSDLQEYLERWGFRFSGELMLTVASFQEDPLPLLDMLKSYLQAAGPSPVEAIRHLESEREAATARQGVVVRLILRATRRSITLRERARAKQALLYSRCRRIALMVGEHFVRDGALDRADDVFFLTYPELDEFLSGNAMFPDHVYSTVAPRKSAHHEWLHVSLPDTFECPEGEYASAAHLNTPMSGSDEEMNGIGACGGRVTAPAAVLESVGNAENLRQGDVLVTRQTDPGWAPVFFLIRGLVIERGGMLSHGAIIAREFGLPCVVGVKNATQRIPHRCMLSVNGDHGHVRIVD